MMTPFAGHARKERRIGPFRLVETQYLPDVRIPRHAHEHPYFYIVLAGGFSEQLSTGVSDYVPGWVTYRAAREPHATRIGHEGACCLMVQLETSPPAATRATLSRSGTLAARSAELTYCAERLVREFNASDAASELAAEGFILAILAQLARERSRGHEAAPAWLRLLASRLRESFRDPVDAAALAADAGVSRAHLFRSFQRFYGRTMGEFVRDLRLAAALSALASSDSTVGEIAHAAGFADHSHFTRVFRRNAGVTPASFRRLHRQVRSLPS